MVSEWSNVSDVEYRLQGLIVNIKCRDFVSEKVQHQAPLTKQLLCSQLVLPPYTFKIRGGRMGRFIEVSSVLPPNTIKIREGRSICPHHSQAHVLPSHAIKTRRGHSTHCQAHILPPHAVKTRGGGGTLDLLSSSSFELGHGEVHLSTTRLDTSANHYSPPIQVQRLYSRSKTSHHSNVAKPTSFPYCSIIAASSTKSRHTKANLVQSMTDFILFNYPPFWGDGQMTKKCPKFIYEYREQISHPPSFCPFWGGYCPFCPYWGDIGPFCYP